MSRGEQAAAQDHKSGEAQAPREGGGRGSTDPNLSAPARIAAKTCAPVAEPSDTLIVDDFLWKMVYGADKRCWPPLLRRLLVVDDGLTLREKIERLIADPAAIEGEREAARRALERIA